MLIIVALGMYVRLTVMMVGGWGSECEEIAWGTYEKQHACHLVGKVQICSNHDNHDTQWCISQNWAEYSPRVAKFRVVYVTLWADYLSPGPGIVNVVCM